MATKILERAAFVGGRLFQPGDEVEVASSNPNILIPASSSPIGNLTLAQVAVFLRYKAEEAGLDVEALIYPEGPQAEPEPVNEVAPGAPAAAPPAAAAPVEVAAEGAAEFVPFEKRLKADLIAYLGDESPAPDGATKAQLVELAEAKHAKLTA